ncbi:MAG: ATP-grasp domain-containing protein [Flavobacteriales bacterium]
MQRQRPLIAILRGGSTGESVISMQSAQTMLDALDQHRYQVVLITVRSDGWRAHTPTEEELIFHPGSFAVELNGDLRPVQGALIAIHGAPGENGVLQGYLDMLGVPYQTGGVLNMALTMSKHATVAMLRDLGFPVAASVRLQQGNGLQEEQLSTIGYPCFVKPDQSGSSLGVTKVRSETELKGALDTAFKECPIVLVERGVTGREVTCGVLILRGRHTALPVCEISTSREFFDYEAKYHAADTIETVPADLPPEVTALVQERSRAIAHALGCRGMVRVDHIWTGSELITIEVNTVPGFSKASIYPKMLHAAGRSIPGTINTLVEELLEQGRRTA